MPSPAVSSERAAARERSDAAIRLVEHHVACRSGRARRVLQEQRAVRVDDVVGRRAAERLRPSPRCPLRCLRSRRTRRPASRRSRRSRPRARTPRGTSRSGTTRAGRARSSTRSSDLAVADDRLELLAHLHDAGLHRPLERQPALAALDADAQRRTAAAAAARRRCRAARPPAAAGPSSGVAPAARIAARASSADSNRSLISRSSGIADMDSPIKLRSSRGDYIENPAPGRRTGALFEPPQGVAPSSARHVSSTLREPAQYRRRRRREAKPITFIVLPSPPGRISVFAPSRRPRAAYLAAAGSRSTSPRAVRK